MSHLRLAYGKLSPEAYNGLIQTSMALSKSSLGHLVELVYLRISQINGCAFCLDMHSTALRKAGYSQHKMDILSGWRMAEAFDARERAALDWAEAVTHISYCGTSDELFATLKEHFNDTEIADLTFAISLMNAFNRMAISMRQ
ncbi:carboxymuconolactone decarboxylase family protein [Hafnia alvei]|jgi:AhpD family alkylhydroperoxidase|uniref:Alkylhydroperoxidase n=2 Tax=Hafniaceae TaxID=1903412 RepID=A0A097R4M0_HAFAL|nr:MULTISPECIES: carboxymuconolactone decarboxylase family protein [Hafniaceae]MDN5986204.1 carboxymuconolactone decarboxylase family protein [Hafniaceae bacterium]MDN6018595.1 carboxymuconolactone decarboxylase family protein [Enterobacterales bacterium]NEY28227.1 carboxymuconolactone decarboxylase family protein [Escherichia coli]AIU73677.1 alkylhydroperoxidase [Hafnia alvei FB1]AMO82904.1 alkylhydroperoxidase [Obesumbacterium proteus]